MTSEADARSGGLQTGSLESEPRAPGEAKRSAAFKLRRAFTVGVWQTQANRAQLGGMPVNEFARYAERACRFADRHERIIFGINHTRQAVRSALSVHPRSKEKLSTSLYNLRSAKEFLAHTARRVA
jgi:hypothetical protein